MVTLAAQTLLAAIGAAVLVWFSAKIATALSGVAVQATMQGMAMAGAGGVFSSARKAAGAADSARPKVGEGSERLAEKRAAETRDSGSSRMESPKARRAASIKTMQRINAQNK